MAQWVRQLQHEVLAGLRDFVQAGGLPLEARPSEVPPGEELSVLLEAWRSEEQSEPLLAQEAASDWMEAGPQAGGKPTQEWLKSSFSKAATKGEPGASPGRCCFWELAAAAEPRAVESEPWPSSPSSAPRRWC